MDITILAKTTNKKGVIFLNPIIDDKSTLIFEDNSIGGNAYYNVGSNSINIKLSKKYADIAITEEDREILDEIHKVEFQKVIKFKDNLVLNKTELLVKDDLVYTKELLDNGFNAYYTKLFNFIFGKKVKRDFKDFEETQKYILDNVNLSKYKVQTVEEYGEFHIIPIKDIK